MHITYPLFKDEVISFPQAKPFLKWAGGKSQLVEELHKRLPESILQTRKIDVYVEPFVGGGAFFFYLKGRYKIGKAYLFDVNKDLILAYKVVQAYPKELIQHLENLEEKYLSLGEEEQKNFYYKVREDYNIQRQRIDYSAPSEEWVIRVAYLIFLNKTCYNGLYRLNKDGDFNVPHGRYKNPKICDSENIIQASWALQDTEVFCGDFEKSSEYIRPGTLVYLDPPYRPISKTSSFTSYTEEGFSDEDQIRLAEYFKRMHDRGAYLLLSNSDPKNVNPNDDFFDKLYKGFIIERVPAKRFINSDAKGRGTIMELIIRNYER
ncbi:DNA adenine methylase [Fervidobacterium islandicum]|uniref:Site-specific DNA-methyltransferase (adenine-specific) n=1 Tax=Fervidobacterium islandicum TaxID=2423 RepID=A0AAI8CP01_FERIS|nr:DNA adenine methylase [Fervidobacterium islandicum]AMW33785.2 DNA adenine methylase [Fervidobacterium islandicum]